MAGRRDAALGGECLLRRAAHLADVKVEGHVVLVGLGLPVEVLHGNVAPEAAPGQQEEGGKEGPSARRARPKKLDP